MPRFVRFTGAQGIHARQMRGSNASHGCVGVFDTDATYINDRIRELVGKSNFGHFTAAERQRSRAEVTFVVRPYRDQIEVTF